MRRADRERAISPATASSPGPATPPSRSPSGVPAALLTTSCTHALEMAALLLRIAPGDEVILPSFTFVSTANAFVLRGARPSSPTSAPTRSTWTRAGWKRLLTPRTRAIVAVHYAGVGLRDGRHPGDRGRPGRRSRRGQRARPLRPSTRGSSSARSACLATQSFHETKNFTCGEGGALLINDPAFDRERRGPPGKGNLPHALLPRRGGQVHLGGRRIELSPLGAARRVPARPARGARRDPGAATERSGSATPRGSPTGPATAESRLPAVPGDCEHPFHMFYLILPSRESRQGLIAHLKERGILAVFHYLPLHLSAMGRSFGGVPGSCPVTEDHERSPAAAPLLTTI